MEDVRKQKLMLHYGECKKYIILKIEYYRTTDILKSAAASAKSKNRNEYYFFSK